MRIVLSSSRFSTIPRQRAKGVSLVELMVAIAIGLVISLAVTILFSQVIFGFKRSDEGSRVLENGNFAIRILGEDLRMAGYMGLFDDPARVELAKAGMISTSADQNCGATNWALPYDATSRTVRYIEQLAPSAVACIPSGGFDSNSNALIVRRASGIEMPRDSSGAVASFAADDNNLYVQSSHTGAIAFMGKDYTSQVKGADRHMRICTYKPGAGACVDNDGCSCPKTGANANKGSVALAEGPVNPYLAHVYYVRPCSRPAGTTCAATDDNGQPIPTLVRRQLSNTDPITFVEVPIAEGVERMAFSWGIDTNNDGAPDRYVPTPNAAQLSTAVTVRMSLLLRTRQMEQGEVDSGTTYTLADGNSYTCSGAGCRYRRYMLTDTVQLKNYAIRR